MNRMKQNNTPPKRKLEWRRAWKALQALIDDSQRTDQVFEIIDALAGDSFEREFHRVRTHPDGRRLLTERPSLLATLSDRATLRTLPEGSFGRAYLEFMESNNLAAEGLVQADLMVEQRKANPQPEDPDRQFLGERMRDMHDLWHVLTGYGMDEAGEAANLAFTLAQIPTPGIALIVLAAAVLGPRDRTLAWPRYLFRSWRRGRRAVRLSLAPYERLLPLPLDEVRRLLLIQPPAAAHPEGIAVGTRLDSLANQTAALGQ